jgi:hypothetical protein
MIGRLRDISKYGFFLYLAFGAGVVFGSLVGTVTTLAVTGLPDAQDIYKNIACEEDIEN